MKKHCLIKPYDRSDSQHVICITCDRAGHYQCKRLYKREDIEIDFEIPDILSDDEEENVCNFNDD